MLRTLPSRFVPYRQSGLKCISGVTGRDFPGKDVQSQFQQQMVPVRFAVAQTVPDETNVVVSFKDKLKKIVCLGVFKDLSVRMHGEKARQYIRHQFSGFRFRQPREKNPGRLLLV